MDLASKRLHYTVAISGENADCEQKFHPYRAIQQASPCQPQDRLCTVEDHRRCHSHQHKRQAAAYTPGDLLEVPGVEDQTETHHVGPEERSHTRADEQVAAFRIRGLGVRTIPLRLV